MKFLINYYYDYSNQKFNTITLQFIDEDGNTHNIEKKMVDYVYTYSEEFCSQVKKKFPNIEIEKTIKINLFNKDDSTRGFSTVEKPIFKVTMHGVSLKDRNELYSNNKNILYEYDVSQMAKFLIDNEMYIGKWYDDDLKPVLNKNDVPKIKFFTIDIETSSKDFCLSNPKLDEIMSIAILFNNEKGYILFNKKFYGSTDGTEKIIYNGKNKLNGTPFKLFEMNDEKNLLNTFFLIIKALNPNVIITYNGDFFDLPYIIERADIYNLNYSFLKVNQNKHMGWFLLNSFIHLDILYWVKRDSYAPMGERGLKDMCKSKLRFEPDEINYMEMMDCAKNDPLKMLHYNASDVICTKLLSDEFVFNFLLNLGNDIGHSMDYLLRKGTAGLSNRLLMSICRQRNILIASKASGRTTHIYDNRVLKTQSYVGGSVESTVQGLYFNKFDDLFSFDETLYNDIVKNLPTIIENELLKFGKTKNDCLNLKEVYESVLSQLENCFKMQSKGCKYKIYHFDVVAFYPSIMRTFKLQPHAIYFEKHCEYCIPVEWILKGDEWEISVEEYKKRFDGMEMKKIEAELKKCKSKSFTEKKSLWMCQQAIDCLNFVVKTIQEKRDVFKKMLKEAIINNEPEYIQKKLHFNQLCYKCLLNSIYGTLKTIGNRFGHEYSPIVGAIITCKAREIIEETDCFLDKISKRLNRDTDGTYRRIPETFPIEIKVCFVDGKSIHLNFVNALINWNMDNKFTNHTFYENGTVKSYSLLQFEADGPKNIMFFSDAKKKYLEFEEGKLSGIKGWKRRGELQCTYNFQNEFFSAIPLSINEDNYYNLYNFLKKKCVDKFINILISCGEGLTDNEVLNLFCVTKCASRPCNSYKSKIPVCEAIRKFSEFTGDALILERSNVSMTFIVARFPNSTKVTDRVIPTLIFSSPKKEHYLKLWTGQNKCSVKDVLDFEYYKEKMCDVIERLFGGPYRYQCGDWINPLAKIKKRKGRQSLQPCKKICNSESEEDF